MARTGLTLPFVSTNGMILNCIKTYILCDLYYITKFVNIFHINKRYNEVFRNESQ